VNTSSAERAVPTLHGQPRRVLLSDNVVIGESDASSSRPVLSEPAPNVTVVLKPKLRSP
jgi:hypothetical protein